MLPLREYLQIRVLRRVLHDFVRRIRHAPDSAMADFQRAALRLRPSDIAIDCGANVGEFTMIMARTGARVFAFEPNPVAFAELCRNTRELSNVHPIQAAVTTEPGMCRLYLHEHAAADPLQWSTGSSLLSDKPNVRSDAFVQVEGIQLTTFLRDLGSTVGLMKMDIEGLEVAVLNQIIDENLHGSVALAFIETHERKMPDLSVSTDQLRTRLRERGISHFRLDWH